MTLKKNLTALDLNLLFENLFNPKKTLAHQKAKYIFRILDRNNYRCVKCGSNSNLTIDHIIPIRKKNRYPKDFRNYNNCQVLCFDCHNEKTKNEIL